MNVFSLLLHDQLKHDVLVKEIGMGQDQDLVVKKQEDGQFKLVQQREGEPTPEPFQLFFLVTDAIINSPNVNQQLKFQI